MNLAVQWALFGKEDRDMEDYRVLKASRGPLPPSGYEHHIRHYLPGTPGRDAGARPGADTLPWVWLSPEEGEASLGLAMLDKGTKRDFGGRRTHPTRYYRLSWSELASTTPSYVGLFQKLRGHDLPTPDELELIIDVESLDVRQLADAVDTLGFEWVATIAALLLGGPLALINPGPLPLEERLSCMDAIAALLPYGLRAVLAAATWADSTARVRLNFGARARPGQQAVEWGVREAPHDLDRGEAASRYLWALRQLHGRHDTGWIIQSLAAQTSPLSFDEPEQAVERLRSLDRGYIVLSELRTGRRDHAEVRDVLVAGEVHGLDPDEVGELVDYLLLDGDAADLPVVERYWMSTHAPRLSAVVAGVLGEPDGTTRARPYLDLAERNGFLDQLLTDMLVGQGEFERDSRPSPMVWSQRLDLVRPYVEGPGRDDLLKVRRTLLQEPVIVYDLMASTPPETLGRMAQVFVQWLGGKWPGRELQPLCAIVEGSTVEYDDLRALWQLGPQHVRTLLGVAKPNPGAIATILPLVWRELPRLISAQELSASEQRAWLRALAVPGVDTTTQVRLQLLVLVLDGPDVEILQFPHDDTAEYLQRFHEAYWVAELEHIRPLLAERVIRHVGETTWTRPITRANNALGLLRCIADPLPPLGDLPPRSRDLGLPKALIDRILDLVSDGTRREPRILELPQYKEWWKPLLERSPTHAPQHAQHQPAEHGQSLEALERSPTHAPQHAQHQPAEHGQSLEAVVTFAGKVLLASAPRQREEAIRTVLSRLAKPQYFSTTAQFDVFLLLLRAELRLKDMPAEQIASIDRRIVSAALDGELGYHLAHAYPRHVGNLAGELDRIGQLIESVRHLLTVDELERLHVAVRRLEQQVRRPGGGSAFGWLRPGRGGQRS